MPAASMPQLTLTAAAALAALVPVTLAAAAQGVNSTTCNGASYVYQSLAGFGFVPSNATDKFGDTLGGYGSAIAMEYDTWARDANGVYTGILHTLPDRGWNTNGTLNYQGRIHKWQLTYTPNPQASVASPGANNIQLQYLDTVATTGPSGHPTTGIDGAFSGHLGHKGFPQLPVAHWVGDGFGGAGNGGTGIPTDTEGLVLGANGTYWVSDEYGPYVYKFDANGRMIEAIRPPNAYIPLRNGTESWSADSPPLYDPSLIPNPENNPTGRQNNHGFEGLTASPDGNTLYVLLQAALNQDGGESSSTETNTRMLVYDVSQSPAVYLAEYVVPLPMYNTGSKFKTAATSEFHYISPTQFLILARDSNAGYGQESTLSLYRHIDVFDISNATSIKSRAADRFIGSIANEDTGVLNSTVTPALYCSWLDFNVNSQLNRFGVHNGGAQDEGLLNEKWESIALLPTLHQGTPNQYILFSFSDNDFVTQDGHLNHGQYAYADPSGYNFENQMLAFNVKLPVGAQPYKSK